MVGGDTYKEEWEKAGTRIHRVLEAGWGILNVT